jgi:uncharacterized membrane protein
MDDTLQHRDFSRTAFCAFARLSFFVRVFLLSVAFTSPFAASAASLALDPVSGTFVVGSTFEVPIVLDSGRDAVNAIEIAIKFPPEKLQLVSPSTGHSIITLWTSQPSFNNENGTLSLQGVIPNGLVTSRGLITTLVFRVKNPGDAYVRFFDATKVLKHDGLGTDVLGQTNDGVYRLIMPPPNGPIVASPTHPDSSVVYRTNSLLLNWTPEEEDVEQYSYMLSKDPIDIPDDVPEGQKTSVAYKNVEDGPSYFHIKGLRKGAWGGTTNFAANIDVTPPAEFPIEVLPSAKTVRRQPILQFSTTDAFSGIDHYELKVVPLSFSEEGPDDSQKFFIEASSPYVIPPVPGEGKYDAIVRAYDKAGNFREETARFEVTSVFFSIAGDKGVEFSQRLLIPWWIIFLVFGLLILILVVVAIETRKRHLRAHSRINADNGGVHLPMETEANISAIQEKQKQYLPITHIVILLALFLGSGFFGGSSHVFAETLPVEPPLVTTISRNITNDEIFYVGGVSGVSNANVILYIQNLATGEVLKEKAITNERGEWFYRHGGFLGAGDYVLWVQMDVGGTQSPPSPQERLSVRRTAFQLGASRLSYEFAYGVTSLVFLLIICGLIYYIIHHERHARRKHAVWTKEVREAEESIRRGFAVLKRDIEAELAVVRKAKLTKELKAEEVGREAQLLKDLEWVERNITKEVWDIERNT